MTNEELMEIGLKAYGQEFRKGDRKGYIRLFDAGGLSHCAFSIGEGKARQSTRRPRRY